MYVMKNEKKYVKGSVTIEAAIIVPIFMIMLVQITMAAISCHDQSIYNSIAIKAGVRAEFGARKQEDIQNNINEIAQQVNSYLDEKTIQGGKTLSLSNDILSISSQGSVIAKNDPVDFTWLTDAARKLIKEA